MNKIKRKHHKQGKFTLIRKSDPTTRIVSVLTPMKIVRYKGPFIFRNKKEVYRKRKAYKGI